jgi:hypothetical protein
MMRTTLIAIAALAALPASAEDFSVGSTAKSWNLYSEVPALFEAKVVDITCEITGDCPADCGAGARQLGLLRAADGVLVYPNKNAQPLFTGAAQELLPYCGQQVEVDGLMLDDAEIGANNLYLVQKIRAVGAAEWVAAKQWTKDWEAANPEAAGEGPWFKRDPRVLAEIATNGYFGLGLEQDAVILQELRQ